MNPWQQAELFALQCDMTGSILTEQQEDNKTKRCVLQYAIDCVVKSRRTGLNGFSEHG